jgi:hypothetical protein
VRRSALTAGPVPAGVRTLARVPRGEVFGGFDLGPGRAAWSVGEPSGFQRIRLQRL